MNAVVQVSDVTQRFGGLVAMDRVSFEVPPRGVTALMGPNGAGKTTAFNVISGHVRPQSGTVQVFGRSSLGRSPAELAEWGLARSWQDSRIYPELTVVENLAVAVRCRTAESAWGRLLRPRVAQAQERAAVRRADDVLERIGLASKRMEFAADISYAEQRLLGVGQLLMREPRLMMLDEPAAGLDGDSIDGLVEIIRGIAQGGVPVLIVEHSLSVVRALADFGVFMSNGVVVAQGEPDALFSRADLIDAYFGKGWRA